MLQDVTMIHPSARVIGKSHAEHDASSVARNRDGIHPARFVQNVVQAALLVGNLDAHDPTRIDVDVEGMVRSFRGDLELRLPCKPCLAFSSRDWIAFVVFAVLTRLAVLLTVC